MFLSINLDYVNMTIYLMVQIAGVHICVISTQELVNNAILGIVIGICIAFPVLVLATMNIIVGFLATLVIGCITTCVIGIIPMVGWKLDVGSTVLLYLLVASTIPREDNKKYHVFIQLTL